MTDTPEPIVVPVTLAGERVDRAVALLSGWSRRDVQELVKRGEVLLEGQVVAGSRRLAGGEVLELLGEPAPPGPPQPEDMALQVRYDRLIKQARGRGLLLGMEFPNTEIGYKVVSGLFRRNVLVAGTLTNSRVVRFEPALNVADPLLDEILDKLEDTLKEIDRTVDTIVPDED